MCTFFGHCDHTIFGLLVFYVDSSFDKFTVYVITINKKTAHIPPYRANLAQELTIEILVYAFMCMHVCYVCMYVCMYACLHVGMYVCVSMYYVCIYCMYVCMYVYMYVCMYVWMYACICVHVYVCMHDLVCVCVCVCVCVRVCVYVSNWQDNEWDYDYGLMQKKPQLRVCSPLYVHHCTLLHNYTWQISLNTSEYHYLPNLCLLSTNRKKISV